MANPKGAALGDPFELVGDSPLGVICVHGFTGTPYEMRYLGEAIARAGHSVMGLRLPGHGTRPDELARTPWRAWADAVSNAVDAMRRQRPRVAIVGQSLGGLLALFTATERDDLTAIASLGAPLWLEGLSSYVAKWAVAGKLRRIPMLPKLGGPDVRDRRSKRENPCYRVFPTAAVAELAHVMDEVRGRLARVTTPLLVMHGARDHTAPVECAPVIAREAHAERMRVLPRSYHLIAIDLEREIVASEVTAFLRRHATA